ncbi:helix-hairpin-helix domain-containing protein [Streptococcus hillyeri]|uniref:Helix-hairpin-helix domain-containing protein n=1 Tax=Streptococcus hillyeri TaxID=2282420 RepID=A0A3L9DSF2_9STRE|nr:helix-hairpin-helix domain-containing protein [Streptococcus hillyeri]RLY02953.1 helix-hairpin-helix domain-containing protein [Streptococcus hillyeri]
MKMVKNRKKALKHQMKRQGLLKTTAPVVNVAETALTKEKSAPVSKATLSLEEFSAISAVADIRSNLVETLYNEGIRSLADFANVTEKELLALKGIGPATVKKLKENGVTLKA